MFRVENADFIADNRIDHPVRLPSGRIVRPDVVFTRKRVVLFIDGCFWHGCPEHGTLPATNRGYWEPKIDENRRRDRRHTAELEDAGWAVVRAWEHEESEAVVQRLMPMLAIPSERS